MVSLSRLVVELRRRNVFKAGAAYIAAGWVVFKVVERLLPVLGAPDWVLRVFLLVMAIGLPLMLAFSWAFEITPEGLKRTAEIDPDASQTRATGRKMLYLIAALMTVAVGLQLAGSWGVAREAPAKLAVAINLPTAADAVAVMPFQTSGPETSVWEEGLMNMLSTNLDGMGGLQAISPRTVLARIREMGATGTDLDLGQTLQVAQAAGASRALVGTVVSTGEIVRITADLQDTGSGAVLARLQVEGPETDVLPLVDRLTVQVVEATRTQESTGSPAFPAPNLSALTTASLPALRAYLEEERLYRQAKLQAAVPRLEQAVQLDSTFAMAHLRLSDLYSFDATGDGTVMSLRSAAVQAREHLRAARRHGNRLPPREAAILTAAVAEALEGDRQQAAAILEEAVRRFPRDPELRFAYADAIFNPVIAWTVLGREREAVRPQTGDPLRIAYLREQEAALALDSSYTPPYFRLIAHAIAGGGTTAATQLLSAFQRHAGGAQILASLEGAYQLAHGDSATQAAVLERLRRGAYMRGGSMLQTGLMLDPGPEALRAQAQAGAVSAKSQGLYSTQAQAWLRGGRYSALQTFIEDSTQTSRSARLRRSIAAAQLQQRGRLDAETVPPGLAEPLCQMGEVPPYRIIGCFHDAWLRGMPAARSRAETIFIESEADLRRAGDWEWADIAEGYRLALRGLQFLEAGRPTEAYPFLDRAHVKLDELYRSGGEWLLVEVHAASLIASADPARAVPYAQIIQSLDPYGHYLEGRAHEATGNDEAARTAYQRFESAWRDADPDIPALQHARTVLAGETTAEPPPL